MGRFHHQFLVTVLLVALLVGNGCAFSVVSRLNTVGRTDVSCQDANGPDGATMTVGRGSSRITRSPIMTGGAFVSGLLISAAPAFAEEVQYAELPPPYIPVIFGLGLLVSVGLLTGSLGDVIDEESQLGLQSGTKARKEIERSRSSYFKNKKQ